MIRVLSEIKDGFNDYLTSFKNPLVWSYLAYMDISMRYKRSSLGPWWVTISIVLIVLVLSTIWPQLLSEDFDFFVPYFAIGYVLWFWFSNSITESTTAMIEFEGLFKQSNIPLSAYLLRVTLRNFIIFLHNAVLIIVIVVLFSKNINESFIFLSLPAIFLIFISLNSISIVLAIFSLRFRDLTNIIATLMQLLFFVTPIIWHPSILEGGRKGFLVDYNIFYYWIDIIRQPLLGLDVHVNSLSIVFLSTVFFLIISCLFIGRFKKKIIFWM